MRYFILFFWVTALFSKSTDYDVVIVGTSPFSLVEALYSYHSGQRVLVLEQSNECGGAWQSLTVCGIPHVDLGCHQIGHDAELLNFFEEYLGCKMVSLENPLLTYMNSEPKGYYFSKGCYECVDHLLKLIEKTEITLLMNHRLESVKIDPSETLATIKTNELELTTSKLVVPIYSDIRIENHPTIPLTAQEKPKVKFQHLYILLEDPLSSQFTYCDGRGLGIVRMMNLTHFIHLTDSGKQLIAFQFRGEVTSETAQEILDHLKENQYVSSSARILCWDIHVYEQSYFDQNLIHQTPNASAIFKMMSTGHIFYMSQYVQKWKEVLKPYTEVMGINIESN